MAKIRRHSFPIWGSALALLRILIGALALSGLAFSAGAAAPNKTAGSQAAFRGFIETLWPLAEARGVSRPFKGQIEQWTYVPLDETGRAAKRVRELLDVSAKATDMKGQGL